MEREKAALGVFITLEPPTQPMRVEAAAAGYYQSDVWQRDVPRIQIATIEELLAGRRPDIPRSQQSPYAQATRIRRPEGTQPPLAGG